MKPPEEPASGNGMRRCRVRVRARASYVDESLFGSPAGTKLPPPDFDPPWVEADCPARAVVGSGTSRTSAARGNCETTASGGGTSTLTPKKKNRYRLISHTPSYCDESLFGPRPEGGSWQTSGRTKGSTAKLHALLWTPPPTPRETPLRAMHPTAAAAAPGAEPRVLGEPRRRSPGPVGSPHLQGRARSPSVPCVSGPDSGHPRSCTPDAREPRNPRLSTSGVTFRSPLVTPRALAVSISGPSTPRPGGVTQKPKPPWK
ncbi:RBPJ-interacting and tubulin-associated protein 1 [Ochotona princeps]|uniref:RBPJ-interacting and tubulin-associated protein 1 n=1 Tax=Ochotona princeps TaxID=9978 RepID=UPI002714D97C|nr:RBPJ-interacting and tubulin-associated protein 1 [Ochotona princeps]